MKRSISLAFVSALLFACAGGTPPANGPKEAKADPEYDTLCAGVAAEDQATCPMRWVKTVEDVEGGIVMHLGSDAPAVPELEKRMKCHRAWMAHDPKNDMPGCPLGSPGITVSASSGAQGPDLKLVATSPADVAEVRRRAHARFDGK